MLRDLVYALRQFRRSPGFTLAAILTLALGIGANTALFEVLDAIAFRSLPVKDPERLFRVQVSEKDRPINLSVTAFRELSAQQQAADLIAVSDYPLHAAVVRRLGSTRTINAVLVSENYFDVLGVGARVGRTLVPGDETAAVISDRFWEREFARSPAALGQTLAINNAVVTIVGVAPREFSGETQGNAPDAWLPMAAGPIAMATDWRDAPNAFWLAVIARLHAGVTPQQAAPQLTPHGPAPYRVRLEPAGRGIAILETRFERPLFFLMAVAGTVLSIACCNLANLLLFRGAARAQEIGIRLALGAGRSRIVRQLLTESLALALAGSAVALAVAQWVSRALVQLAATETETTTDWRVLGFTAAITGAAACLFAIAPALATTRIDVRRRRSVGGRVLVVAQVAASVILLSGAALLMRSLWSLRHQDFGFHSDHVLMAQLPWEFNPAMMARYAALRGPLLERASALPGVRSAALSGFGPMGGDQHTGPVSSPEHPARREDLNRIVHVSAPYFETLGIPIVAGRPLTSNDRADTPKVVVLSETAARALFGSPTAAVGRSVSLASRFEVGNSWEVAGVAHDVRFADPAEPFGFLVYVTMEQSPAPITAVILRTTGDPTEAAANLRAALLALDPMRAVGAIRPLDDTIDRQLTQERLLARIAGCFGLLSLVLTSIGVYGVVAYAVARRTREMGIRLALGATGGQVTAGLMREVAMLLIGGTVPGVLGAILLTRVMRTMLFAPANHDYSLLAAAGVALCAATALAAYLPARRAARLDPAATLRA